MSAAPSLADLDGLSSFHALIADRAGQFVATLDGPYRLVFVPSGCGTDAKSGEIDRAAVTAITIIEIVDYHGRP